jgi:thiamine pyrophosphate-dependent acetolactate synthase large subunit-like protein
MRELVKDYLEGTISRRTFMRRMSLAGFSAMAATSALKTLQPLSRAYAATTDDALHPVKPFSGRAGELLVAQLKEAGVEFLFLGNGSGLGTLCDALVDRPEMRIIQGVHEGQCASMADGYAKASGKIAFAMFSPRGLQHASSNMKNAMSDRTPLLFMTDGYGGEEGNEVDAVEQFTKFRLYIEDSSKVSEWAAKAIRLASTLPGGPTYLRAPRRVLFDQDVNSHIYDANVFDEPMSISPDPELIERAAKMLLEAERPIMHVGMEVTSAGGVPAAVELADSIGIPVIQEESWAADFPTTHPCFAGMTRQQMFSRLSGQPDVLLNLGGQTPPGHYPDAAIPNKVIHGRVEERGSGISVPEHLVITASVKETAQALAESIKSQATATQLRRLREPRQEEIRRVAQKVRQSFETAARRRFNNTPMTWQRVGFELNEVLDRDAVIVEEFGTNGPKVLNWFKFGGEEKTRIGRTTGSCLGWGVGASIGAKLARPNNQVACLQADGGFLFGQIESLWSMSRYDVPIILVIFNNRSYNETRTRMFRARHNGRQLQERIDMLSHLGNPDVSFTGLAGAFGIKGEQVANPDQLRPALQRAVKATRDGRPYLVDVLIERTGAGAEISNFPDFSLATSRTRKV